ncbi:MAG: prevent-host-death protein [Gemmatimonadetes bacterium]|jgi:antitoxin (DNA-binding transcriptional repressor) of toxin-antitoxin stability system|nr:prevent-host-death protein [Gemmatimonadota bacterium]
MTTVSKSYLKTHMLRIFREIEQSGQELIVTDNRVPVLKILPLSKQNSVAEIFAGVQGKVLYKEDINAPTEEEWTEL